MYSHQKGSVDVFILSIIQLYLLNQNVYALYNQGHFDILFDSCLKEGERCFSILSGFSCYGWFDCVLIYIVF